MYAYSVLHFCVIFDLIRFVLEFHLKFNVTRNTYLHLTYGLSITKRKLVLTESYKIARVLYKFLLNQGLYFNAFVICYGKAFQLNYAQIILVVYTNEKKNSPAVPGI